MTVDMKKFIVDEQPSTAEQINMFVKSGVFDGEKMRFMPDAHCGKGAVVGTAMTYSNKIVPSVVGVDIGCTVSAWKVSIDDIDLEKFDGVVNTVVPSGFAIHNKEQEWSTKFSYDALHVWKYLESSKQDHIRKSMGTLGGGNHYCALERSEETGDVYLMIHCGSRNLGVQVEKFYENKAKENTKAMIETINMNKNNAIKVYKDCGIASEIPNVIDVYNRAMAAANRVDGLDFITGKDMQDYLNDMLVCQSWAIFNHLTIAENIFAGMGWDAPVSHIICQHNYVDTKNKIIRKGAISARDGELGIIPLNMRDGSLIVRGKGNEDWLQTLPHGAGRTLSRGEARRVLDINDYTSSMAGIYSTSVVDSTIDEAPMAYKSAVDIEDAIQPNAIVLEHLRPIYNFKAK